MNSQAITQPQHVGFILDGNRRWAKERGLPSLEGHRRGYNNLLKVVDIAIARQIPFVSGYIFSTENWSRSREEVKYLMRLATLMLTRDVKKLHKKGVKVVWLGSEVEVDPKLIKIARDAEELTKDNIVITVGVGFNYGGHREIVEAVRCAALAGETMDSIDEKVFAQYLYGGSAFPPIDLLIRTSGEQRLSGFMLWRAAYSEFIFRQEYWPDFSEAIFDECLVEYSNRQRRFGG